MTTRSCIAHDPLTDTLNKVHALTVLGGLADRHRTHQSSSLQVPAGSNPARPRHLLIYFVFVARNEIPERIAFC